MVFHLHTLRAREAERGNTLSWDDIAERTGIRRATLIAMANHEAKQVRPEYLDALCAFFRVGVNELMTPEPVALPLELNIRPDRRVD
jgi:DNA-binding Xre family transcriptional regulator